MRSIALKLPDELLEESARCADHLGELSRRLREESMRVNAEFAASERDAGA